ncbi:MAG: GAF domain-containing protein, partial [Minisyncoccia bacterium]
LKELKMLDTKPEERFDIITKEASKKFNVPIVTVSLIDGDREWFKSRQGLHAKQGPRATSFCGHIMSNAYILVIEDTLNDPRFSDNPQVIGKPYIRFYAGITLNNKRRDLPVGVFCIKDTKPRKLSQEELHALRDFAYRAEDELNKSLKIKK